MNIQTVITEGIKIPHAIPLIAFGALPLVFAVIAIVACIPACCGACCCSAGACYGKKNKKLQKRAILYLSQENMTVHGVPSVQAC